MCCCVELLIVAKLVESFTSCFPIMNHMYKYSDNNDNNNDNNSNNNYLI